MFSINTSKFSPETLVEPQLDFRCLDKHFGKSPINNLGRIRVIYVQTGWVKHTRIMHLEYLAMRFCQKQLLLNYKPKRFKWDGNKCTRNPSRTSKNFTCLLIKLSTTPVGCCGCLAEDRKIYPKQEEATGQFTAAFSSDIFTQPTRFPSCCEQPKASRRALLNLAEKKGCSRAALTSSGHVMGPSARRLMALFRYTVVAPLDNLTRHFQFDSACLEPLAE